MEGNQRQTTDLGTRVGIERRVRHSYRKVKTATPCGPEPIRSRGNAASTGVTGQRDQHR